MTTDWYPKVSEPDKVLEMAATTMWEEGGAVNGGPAAWLRAWPSGHVHFSHDWLTRLDGKIDTACGRARIYWPEGDWPKAKICPPCEAAFRSLSRAAVSQEED